MKSMHIKWSLLAVLVLNFVTLTNLAEVRGGERGFHGGEMGHRGHFHPENEHPRERYRPEDVKNWQHGNYHGYTHSGMHYNYYHNGNYFNYYHNGGYYNYYNNGNYYNYYNNGLYYLFFYNGLYYNNCNKVPHGYPNCP